MNENLKNRNTSVNNESNITKIKFQQSLGSSCSKLRGLIKKNLLILKRNKITTLCEIFFPIILMLLMYLVRDSFLILEYTYEEDEKNTNNFISRCSVANVDINNTEIIADKSNNSLYWNNLSLIPALSICSRHNHKGRERPLIATIGIPLEIKQKIISDASVYQDEIDMNITMDTFKDFKNIEAMDNYIEDKKFGLKDFPQICFGMRMEEKKEGGYDYSLHYFDSIFGEGIQDLSNIIGGPIDLFRSGPDMQSYKRYRNSGYTYIMKVINEYILRKETKNEKAKLNFGMMPMKYVNYKMDRLGDYMSFIIPFFIIVAYMANLCLYVYRMVSEKESRAKEGMKIMGLEEGIYLLSYFLQYLIINIFVSIINTIIVNFIFKTIPFYYIYILFFLWGMNVLALAFFCQSFLDSTKIALILSLLIYFIMYFISLSSLKETSSKSLKVGLSFLPPAILEITIIMFSEFESHFRKYKPKYFSNIYTNYSLLYMLIMSIVDFFIYTFLGYYLTMVLPHQYGIRKPFYFLFTSEFWCGRNYKPKNEDENQISDLLSLRSKKSNDPINVTQTREILSDSDLETAIENNSNIIKNNINMNDLIDSTNFEDEDLYKDRTQKDDVLKIINIKKVFKDGKIAVNNLNINFYKDEIFALLGHNGAGKTTLISMLTGLYEATQGKAYYDGDNILIGDNMDKFRLKIGICPQHDILFENLTIKEHLNMFSIFKGVPSNQVDQEVKKSLKDFKLEEIKDIVVSDLSAGQKRQLSIAIALIGGSRVIFLDEPSSGMDVASKRNLWEILKRQSENKIIILTTHYMEEASVLGNRIGIISEGKMKCIGTPLFLIEKFGKFMSINIYKEEDANNDKIINYINSKISDTQFEVLSEEILLRIPKNNFSNNSEGNSGINIGEFFNDFDKNLKKLKIKSYSVSMPTLEDVFLNMASEDNKKIKKKSDENNDIINCDKILFDTDIKENYENKSKFCNDFIASFKRRLVLIIRDMKSFLMEILCPIILVLIGLFVSKININWTSDPWTMDISFIGRQNVLFSSIQGIENLTDYFFYDNYINVTCQELSIKNFSQNEKPEAIVNFIDRIYETNNLTEDSKIKEVDMNSDDYVGYFGALLMMNEKDDNYDFLIVVNARVKHGVPIYNFYFMKQIIQKAIHRKINITFTHYPLPLTKQISQRSDEVNNSVFILFIATAFSLIPASFISRIVKERINNSKHLMRISGMNRLSYWVVNYIFELAKYYFTGGICILFIWIFDHYENYLYILYILYGPAMISSTYILSFIFQKEETAQNIIILMNFVVGALGSVVILLLRGMNNTFENAKILEYIFAIMPSFCFNFGYDLLLNKILIYIIEYPDEWMLFEDNEIIKHFIFLFAPILYLEAEIIIYTIILFLIELFSYKYIIRNNSKILQDVKDNLVLEEIEKANAEDISITEEDNGRKISKYSLRLKNIRKEFGYPCSCCCKRNKKIVAIKNLNFCVEPGECFGLLGLNGAGKTTTFKCITQEISPTNGAIYVNGIDTYNNFDRMSSCIGYCPQYEAIFNYLTVKENLEFFARIKGVKIKYLNQLVQAMISEMALDNYTDKISSNLSGGNRRKLSVAVSLLCNPQIILLDEPSTGMDPEARRFMWSIIHKTTKFGKKSSVIMTTHSMDEAETLCKRMGIMVNGEFVCLGKASQIKEKYGYGYEIDIRIKSLSNFQQNEIIKMINKNESKFNEDKINDNLMLEKTLKLDSNNFVKYNKKSKINKKEVKEILIMLNKANYIEELSNDRLGKKINKDIEINGNISLITLLNWVFFIENAFKFIKTAFDYFDEIYLVEFIENNFLFKMKKGPKTKSIGFFFGLFEQHKEECFVTEYSIQQTSLEQIFNMFAKEQTNAKKIEENIKNKKEENDSDKETKSEILINSEILDKFVF